MQNGRARGERPLGAALGRAVAPPGADGGAGTARGRLGLAPVVRAPQLPPVGCGSSLLSWCWRKGRRIPVRDGAKEMYLHQSSLEMKDGTIRRIIIENPDQEPLSPFLRGGNFFPGNNVIYEKTIRKYELLNPQQEKQYQFSQQCQAPPDQCHPAQPCQQPPVTHQCQHTQTSSPCEVFPVSVSDDCGGNTVRRVTVQTCEPVRTICCLFYCSQCIFVWYAEYKTLQTHKTTSRRSQKFLLKLVVGSLSTIHQLYVSRHPWRENSIMIFLRIVCQVNCSQDNHDQLDCRYFGEEGTGIISVLPFGCSRNLSTAQLGDRIVCKNHDVEFSSQNEDIEDLIPKGLSEATKQQIRYLLQMRVTSDKSLRLVLSTFKNLREELSHLQDDLGKLETDNVLLKKDLAFKDSQVKEYETMLASLRENNRQQQQALRDSTARCRSLEEQLLSLRLSEGDKDCQLKELEYGKRALEQEIQSLRLQACSSPTLQTTTDELSSRYVEMINNLREDKDREIRSLRSQLSQFHQDISRREGSNSDLQIRLHELTSTLEEKDAVIKQQQEELFRLKHEKLSGNPSPGVTTIITKKYRNQYPILGLLSDDYKATSPVNKSQTIVIERTGEIWKQVSSTWRLTIQSLKFLSIQFSFKESISQD
ncbi:premature ovarian failure, 1B [Columba livia]|uniref:Premature ovarian failure, 1B n=1 Tax=Columba livia TaxID=8932 RepID=A0A2I0MAS8_COLLI|nr:premature ovarian failure, 1B [Columba livia]